MVDPMITSFLGLPFWKAFHSEKGPIGISHKGIPMSDTNIQWISSLEFPNRFGFPSCSTMKMPDSSNCFAVAFSSEAFTLRPFAWNCIFADEVLACVSRSFSVIMGSIRLMSKVFPELCCCLLLRMRPELGWSSYWYNPPTTTCRPADTCNLPCCTERVCTASGTQAGKRTSFVRQTGHQKFQQFSCFPGHRRKHTRLGIEECHVSHHRFHSQSASHHQAIYHFARFWFPPATWIPWRRMCGTRFELFPAGPLCRPPFCGLFSASLGDWSQLSSSLRRIRIVWMCCRRTELICHFL